MTNYFISYSYFRMEGFKKIKREEWFVMDFEQEVLDSSLMYEIFEYLKHYLKVEEVMIYNVIKLETKQ